MWTFTSSISAPQGRRVGVIGTGGGLGISPPIPWNRAASNPPALHGRNDRNRSPRKYRKNPHATPASLFPTWASRTDLQSFFRHSLIDTDRPNHSLRLVLRYPSGGTSKSWPRCTGASNASGGRSAVSYQCVGTDCRGRKQAEVSFHRGLMRGWIPADTSPGQLGSWRRRPTHFGGAGL